MGTIKTQQKGGTSTIGRLFLVKTAVLVSVVTTLFMEAIIRNESLTLLLPDEPLFQVQEAQNPNNNSNETLTPHPSDDETILRGVQRTHMLPSLSMDNLQLSSRGRYGVVGISSIPGRKDYRDNLRNMWLKNHKQKGFLYTFIFDTPTPELIQEREDSGDVLFLHSNYKGYANHFGEKVALWLKYVSQTFPDAPWVAKSDHDVAVCDRFWDYLDRIHSPKMYMGWMHEVREFKRKKQRTSQRYRMDEFFIVYGNEVVQRVSERPYCHEANETSCNNRNGLYDTNYGGNSMGMWLSKYDDLDLVTMNNEFVFLQKKGNNESCGMPEIDDNFCRQKMILHKTNFFCKKN